MNPHEVVPREVEGQRGFQMVQLLTERIGQPREPAAGHSDREVLALDIAPGDEGRIGLTMYDGWDRLRDLRRVVSQFRDYFFQARIADTRSDSKATSPAIRPPRIFAHASHASRRRFFASST